ncbi:MAG: hypothetical protein JNL11_10735 [Bdellovibrionaceae bacterium]|nr:hypothetical protein [Pseudobdellovibrionaceae bacterium]
MAKRFTDTGKWKMAWFRELSPKLKAVNDFICDNCDHAGIWEIDLESLSFHVNDRNSKKQIQLVTVEEIAIAFQGKVFFIGDDKLFLEPFVLFQYKLKTLSDLKMSNTVHKSIIERLEKYKIVSVEILNQENSNYPKVNILILKGLPMPLVEGAIDKDKDIYWDKDKEKDKESESNFHFESLVEIYPNKVGTAEAFRRLSEQIKTQIDFINIRTAIVNYVRYLSLEKNKSWLKPKNFDSFVGAKSAKVKPWREWINPDPSVYIDSKAPLKAPTGQPTAIDFGKSRAQAEGGYRRTQEHTEELSRLSKDITRSGLEDVKKNPEFAAALAKFGIGETNENLEIKEEIS